ncbi:unnamed protein product, partial [marine sediment metagenome]
LVRPPCSVTADELESSHAARLAVLPAFEVLDSSPEALFVEPDLVDVLAKQSESAADCMEEEILKLKRKVHSVIVLGHLSDSFEVTDDKCVRGGRRWRDLRSDAFAVELVLGDVESFDLDSSGGDRHHSRRNPCRYRGGH